MKILFEFAWGFGIEKAAGNFGESFVVSVSQETKRKNILQQKAGEIRSLSRGQHERSGDILT